MATIVSGEIGSFEWIEVGRWRLAVVHEWEKIRGNWWSEGLYDVKCFMYCFLRKVHRSVYGVKWKDGPVGPVQWASSKKMQGFSWCELNQCLCYIQTQNCGLSKLHLNKWSRIKSWLQFLRFVGNRKLIKSKLERIEDAANCCSPELYCSKNPYVWTRSIFILLSTMKNNCQ